MPVKPKGRCTYGLCNNKAVKDGRCAEHPRKPWTRPSQHTRKLNPTIWTHVRQRVLKRDNHTCNICGREGNEVDHILGIAEGGSYYDMANLQTLCHECHKRKTEHDRLVRAGRIKPKSKVESLFEKYGNS